MRQRISAWDRTLFHQVATRHWPAAETMLPRLSRSANHGQLWFGVAAGIAAVGSRQARRGALRGVGSLVLASATVNILGKQAVRRARPLQDHVPVIRRLHRQPITTSFPSGHSASAAAFATGVAIESPRWGAVVAPVAWSVAFSRIYTGVHYPSDVLAGAAIGAGAAYAVRGLVLPRPDLPAPARPRAGVPALDGGRGLHVVVNEASGPPPLLTAPADRLRTALPFAEITECTEDDDFAELLEKAACRAAEHPSGGALGISGGDGSVNLAASVAVCRKLPLAVFPSGTYNHFALDLGIESTEDAAAAVMAGHAVAVDVARFAPASGGKPATFLNTLALGAWPELVRVRDRWARRVGSWPASVLAAVHVLRTSRPVGVHVNGHRRSVWLLFIGNCAYRSIGLAPVRRYDLADGLLDVRIVDGGPFARTRLLAAALTGALTRSPVYSAAALRQVRVGGLEGGTRLTYDGELAPAPDGDLVIDKLPEALTVYRPLTPP